MHQTVAVVKQLETVKDCFQALYGKDALAYLCKGICAE
jgi:hypothetical protein